MKYLKIPLIVGIICFSGIFSTTSCTSNVAKCSINNTHDTHSIEVYGGGKILGPARSWIGTEYQPPSAQAPYHSFTDRRGRHIIVTGTVVVEKLSD